MAPTPKPIDWEIVDELLEAGCSGQEIAPYFACHPDTLYDRCVEVKGMVWSEYSAIMQCKGEACLRAVQYGKAIGKTDKGDNTMLVWLGKNRLKQRDTPTEIAVSNEIMTGFTTMMEQITRNQSERKMDLINKTSL